MNIEIAERLIKLRKEKGLSQEELAAQLGLSRQAVSKWERAEASPDTDNLICLARIYGVSLDQLLNTSDSVEDIIKEQVKPEKEQTKKKAYTSALMAFMSKARMAKKFTSVAMAFMSRTMTRR